MVESPRIKDPAEWSAEHRKFLTEDNPEVLAGLAQSGSLDQYLQEIGEQAYERIWNGLMERHLHPQTQALPFLKRMEELLSHHRELEEIVRHELIYQPLKDEPTP